MTNVADPKYWLRRYKRKAVMHYARNYSKGVLVDIGCGTAAHMEIFKDHVSKYIRCDYPETQSSMGYGGKKIDVAVDSRTIPFRDASVQSVLLLDVIEHVYETDAVFAEVSRIMKPGATLILTTPFIYPVHGRPDDFHRFTFYSLQKYADDHGLEIVEKIPIGRYGTVLATLINLLVYRGATDRQGLLDIIGKLFGPILKLFYIFVNCVAIPLDLITARMPLWVYLENAAIMRKTK